MKYDPEMSMLHGFSGKDDTAYRVCCLWVELSRKIFPDYMHSKTPQIKTLKKSVLFRTMLKLIKERDFETIGEYELFIKAQLMIFKRINKKDTPVLIEPVILTGDPAERRWFYWNKLVANANKLTKQVYSMQDADMEYDLLESLKEIKKICGDELTFEKYAENSSKIKTSAILRKIKPIYIYLSEWIKKLPEELKNDITQRTDSKSFDKFNVDYAKEIYNNLFDFEINRS
jgi:hypothetical protein